MADQLTEIPQNPQEGQFSRRDVLKGLAAGGVLSGMGIGGGVLLGQSIVERMRQDRLHKQVESAHVESADNDSEVVMGIVNRFVNTGATPEFWDKFQTDLKANSGNFQINHTSTVGDGLTKNNHHYDYWQDGVKNKPQDARIVVLDPDVKSHISRIVDIGLTLGDDESLGTAPDLDSVTQRHWPEKQVEDAFERIFNLPEEASSSEWGRVEAPSSANEASVVQLRKMFKDKDGLEYHAQAETNGSINLTVWYPKPAIQSNR